MFVYCLNNPVNMEDSDGEFAFLLVIPVAIKLAIGIGAVIGAVYTGYTIGTYARHGVEKSNIKFKSNSKSKSKGATDKKRTRSKGRIGYRVKAKTKKEAYERAKRAGKGTEPIHHTGHGKPHYHPNVPERTPQTPKQPYSHDHYYHN